MPYISVILPTYHHYNTVSKAIQSVLEQTYQDFELIIIDDGSSDGTEEIIKSFAQKDTRIKSYRNQINSGCPARICNEAVQNYANGEYIAFQFDDDLWFEWCLECLAANAAGFDLIYGQSIYITYVNKKLRALLGTTKLDRQEILEKNTIANNAVLIKKSTFLELGGFDEDPIVKRACDWELWARMLYQNYKIKNIPQLITICYAGHPNSVGVTSSFDPKLAKSYIKKKAEESSISQ